MLPYIGLDLPKGAEMVKTTNTTLELKPPRTYMAREPIQMRRRSWRQKVHIYDNDTAIRHTFFIDFGEYADGRLGEVFITAHKMGTFVRGTLDTLARTISIALQSGTAPLDMAKSLLGLNYPPCGRVEAEGSSVKVCASIADYLAQEIAASYGQDGKRVGYKTQPVVEKVAGHTSESWRGHW